MPIDIRFENIKNHHYGGKPTMNEYKIMIVDDEPDILELLENHILLHSCKLSLSIWE